MTTTNTLAAPAGFRLRTWNYPEETARAGLVCNECGFCADPPQPATTLARRDTTQAELDAAATRHSCPPPAYVWDVWHRLARARGVDPELAELGREIYRENSQHSWGMRVDDAKLIRDALLKPRATAARWRALLEADTPNEGALL